jgi:hypothetical protein
MPHWTLPLAAEAHGIQRQTPTSPQAPHLKTAILPYDLGMAESTAAIEYDPVAPTAKRRRLIFGLLVVTVAVLLGGVGSWVLRGWLDARSPDAVVIGHASEFPPGSVTELVLDLGHFDPFGLEGPLAEFPAGRRFSETPLFVVSDSEGRLVALSQRSPWMGCRVVAVTRDAAIGFGHELPSGFDTGLVDPCHGGLFSLDGQHLAGQGHRNLGRFPVSYLPDGSVVVDLTGLQPASP